MPEKPKKSRAPRQAGGGLFVLAGLRSSFGFPSSGHGDRPPPLFQTSALCGTPRARDGAHGMECRQVSRTAVPDRLLGVRIAHMHGAPERGGVVRYPRQRDRVAGERTEHHSLGVRVSVDVKPRRNLPVGVLFFRRTRRGGSAIRRREHACHDAQRRANRCGDGAADSVEHVWSRADGRRRTLGRSLAGCALASRARALGGNARARCCRRASLRGFGLFLGFGRSRRTAKRFGCLRRARGRFAGGHVVRLSKWERMRAYRRGTHNTKSVRSLARFGAPFQMKANSRVMHVGHSRSSHTQVVPGHGRHRRQTMPESTHIRRLAMDDQRRTP